MTHAPASRAGKALFGLVRASPVLTVVALFIYLFTSGCVPEYSTWYLSASVRSAERSGVLRNTYGGLLRDEKTYEYVPFTAADDTVAHELQRSFFSGTVVYVRYREYLLSPVGFHGKVVTYVGDVPENAVEGK